MQMQSIVLLLYKQFPGVQLKRLPVAYRLNRPFSFRKKIKAQKPLTILIRFCAFIFYWLC